MEKCIRHRPSPTCYLCGGVGRPLYSGLRDVLFDAPGEWNFSICPDSNCGLVWLNPVPLPEDLVSAYARYYTHECRPDGRTGAATVLSRFGMLRAYDLLLGLLLIRRERDRLGLMYLQETKPAKLLEVGCGDGSRLARFRALGWEVSAVELDAKAAAHARTVNDISVHVGTLEQAGFASDSFDAIIMNHVVEHVYDPLSLLTECRRVLKPGGALFSVTPNVKSFGHRLFGQAWRGLEPPRHIFLFSEATLRKFTTLAGFRAVDTWTTAAHAETIVAGSLDIRQATKAQMQSQLTDSPWADRGYRAGRFTRSLMMAGCQITMTLLNRVNKGSGEECVLKAVK